MIEIWICTGFPIRGHKEHSFLLITGSPVLLINDEMKFHCEIILLQQTGIDYNDNPLFIIIIIIIYK
ncbi:hypothetical protein DERP_008275 [Dermatophagoides pteronyssinus]|uniref:Uncharacterized protein n=1 Tax=Dermatophagoides pteronyssinus TaxID=6956 RepID=A0ABQ8J610_DERPT|nr:hypothetical protein DERP_008275 [Dermatophagoides pteronyssinus]